MALSVKAQIGDLYHKLKILQTQIDGGGGGEANTASNLGGGVGPYDQKVGVDLQFRSLVEASNMISVSLDGVNHEIDLDVVPGNIDLDDLGDVDAGAPNDGDVLTWDAVDGEWEPVAPGGGGAAVNPWAYRRSGRCYTTWDFYTSAAQIISRNTLFAYPFIVPVSQSFDRMIIEVTTACANGEARTGIYEDDGSVYPGALVVSSAAIDCTVNGFKPQVIAETLTAGLYWLVINHDGDADVVFRAIDYNQTFPIGYYAILGHDENNFVTQGDIFWSVAWAYGALPDPFPGGASRIGNTNMVCIMLRVA